MAPTRTLLLGFLTFLLFSVPARAQHEFEFTPFGGARFGGKIDLNTSSVDYLPIKNSWNYGIIADYTLWPRLQAEFQFNHQPTSLEQHVIKVNSTEHLSSADIDMYQFGFNFDLMPASAKLQPFIVGGVGFTNFKAGGHLPFGLRFSYNLGLGAKYFWSRHFGFRAEARWSPSLTTQRNEVFFDPRLARKSSLFQAAPNRAKPTLESLYDSLRGSNSTAASCPQVRGVRFPCTSE